MANVKAVIDVDINTSPAAAGLRSLQSQFNAFSQTLNTANASHARFAKENAQQLTSLVNATQFFTAETVKMRTAASQLDLTLAKGSGTMGQFFSAKFRKDGLAAAQVMSLANARASVMQTQFIATGQAANGMREAIAIRPLQAFNSTAVVSAQKLAIHRAMLNQATTSMINFGKNTQWAGRQLMVGFTVPLTIFAGVAGKAFRELEKEAINFRKVYGDIFTTDVEVEEALGNVRELTREFTKYGVQSQKTMQLAAIAAQAGKTGAELMAATTQATRLAVLGNMENEEAMRSTIALQSAFKMSNEDLAESINFLNMVNNATVLSLRDVAESIPRVAPVIQGLGGDVKDLAVMLVAMREGGVSAAEAANGLKSSLGRLITPSKQAKDMAMSFGINLEDIVQKNAGNLLRTVTELAAAMKGLGDLETQQLLSTLFGKFQYARIGALFQNITEDGSQAQKAMEMMGMSAADAAAVAEKELGAIEQSVATKFTAAMERMRLAIAPIGEMFMKMAIPIVNFFAKIAEGFDKLPDFAKNFLALGAAIVGVVIPAGTMFAGLLMNLIGTLVKVGHLIGLAFKGFFSGGLAGAISNVSQALKYMSLEQIDATTSATQLAGATGAANKAFQNQIPAATSARAAIDQLGISYDIVYQKLMKIASANAMAFGPGAAAMRGAAAGSAAARGGTRFGRSSTPTTPQGFNQGGSIPGVGNTDTVPAMLTPGEFVVNKQATRENLPILHAINDGQKLPGFNKGGKIPGVQYAMSGRLITTRQQLQDRAAALQGFRPEIPTRQSVRIGGISRSESVYQQLMAKNAQTSTKNARVVKFAVEQLGISPGELGLTSRGNFGFALTPESNIKMAKGTLTKQDLLADISNPASLNPLSDQLSRYFKMGVDRGKFLSILGDNINNLPTNLITNKRFEQASRKALYQYLRSERVPREQAGSFMKDILQKTEVSSGLRLERLEEALALRGITARRGGRKDFYVNYQGEELNLGRLLGQEIDSLSKPSDIIRFTRQRDSRSVVPRGLVFAHANKGGMIPAVQHLAGGGIAMLLQNISRQRSMLSGARSFKMLPSGRTARSDRQLFEQEGINFARWSRVSGSGSRGAGYRDAVAAGYITDEERSGMAGRVIAHAIGGRFKRRMAQLGGQEGGYPAGTFQSILRAAVDPRGSFLPGGSRSASFARQQADIAQALPSSLVSVPLKFNNEIARGAGTISSLGRIGPQHMASLMENLMQRNVPPAIARAVLTRASVGLKRNLRRFDGRINESVFYRELAKAENQALIRYEDDFVRLGIRANQGGMIPGGQVNSSRSFYGVAPRAIQMLRSYMAGNYDIMRQADTRRTVMGLARPMSGTFYRGTQLGGGALPKNIEKAMLQAEKTGDFSGLVGKRFRMRASDWSTDKNTALRFTQMNEAKQKKDFLLYEKSIAEKNILRDTAKIKDFEAGRTPWMSARNIEQSRKGIEFWTRDLARINAELEKIGELSPLVIQAKGSMRAVPASQLIPDATYLGKPIAENNIISTQGTYEIRRASRGNLELLPVQRRNLGGLIHGYNMGGDVQAFVNKKIFESARKTIVPGVGNTDTVPAALTPGEFVVNKQATQNNLPILRAINSGKPLEMNIGGMVPNLQYLNLGALVNPISRARSLQRRMSDRGDIYFRRGISREDPDDMFSPQSMNIVAYQKRKFWRDKRVGSVTATNTPGRIRPTRADMQPPSGQMVMFDPSLSGRPWTVGSFAVRPGYERVASQLLGLVARDTLARSGLLPRASANLSAHSSKIVEFLSKRGIIKDLRGDKTGLNEITKRDARGMIKDAAYELKHSQQISRISAQEVQQSSNFIRSILRSTRPAKSSQSEQLTLFNQSSSIPARISRPGSMRNLSPSEQIKQTQIEMERLEAILKKAKSTRTTTSKQYGDIGTELLSQINRTNALSPVSPAERALVENMRKRASSMLEESGAMFNRTRSMGFNSGGMIPGVQYFAAQMAQRVVQTASAAQKAEAGRRQYMAKFGDMWIAKPQSFNANKVSRMAGAPQARELYRGFNPMASRSMPKEIKDGYEIFLRTGDPSKLNALKGTKFSDINRSWSTNEGVATRYASRANNVGDTGAVAVLRDPDGVYGVNPGAIKGNLLSSSRSTNIASLDEVVLLGDPRKGFRASAPILEFQGLDNSGRLIFNVPSQLSKREIKKLSIRAKIQSQDPSSGFGSLPNWLVQQQRQRIIPKKAPAQDWDGLNKGGVAGFNTGNIVPGVGNTDTVPAMLTPGEFVINKEATQQNLGLLHAINSGKALGMNKGGIIPGIQHLNSGGVVQVDGKWYVDDGRNTRGPYRTQAAAERAYSRLTGRFGRMFGGRRGGFPSTSPSAGVGASGRGAGAGMMRGMGPSMGMAMGGMGVMMLGQRMEQQAMERGETSTMGAALSTGGIGLSMASILPFLPAAVLKPLFAIGAPLAAVAGGLGLFETHTNNAAMAAAEMAAGVSGTIHPLKKMAELLGTTTPAQRRAQINLGIGQEEVESFQQEFGEVFSTEQGMQFVDELKRASSPERFEKLSNYLRYAVASEMMDKESAKTFARVISSEIGDSFLGARVSSVLSKQDQGSGALLRLGLQRDLEAQRRGAMQRVQSEGERSLPFVGGISLEDSAAVIATSSLALQDFSNASALAFEELTSGQISVEQYQNVVDQSRQKQGEYTKALVDAIDKTGKLGSSMQVLKDQFMKMGFDESMFKEIEDNLSKAGVASKKANLESMDYWERQGSLLSDSEATIGRVTEGAGDAVRRSINPLRWFSNIKPPWMSDAPIETAGRGIKNDVMPFVAAAVFEGMEPMLAQNIAIELLIDEGGITENFEKIAEKFGAKLAFESEIVMKRINDGELIDFSAGIERIADRAESIVTNRKEKVESIFDEFVQRGGSPDQFLTWIESIPEEKRFNFVVDFGGLSKREQQDYLSDASSFAQAFGQEFQLRLQQSEIYKNILGTQSTRQLREAISSASEAGVAETIIDFAFRESGENYNAEEIAQRINKLTESFMRVQTLPEEIIKTLRINVEVGEDLEKIGPYVEEIEALDELIDKSFDAVDKSLIFNFVLYNGEGEVKTFDEMARSIGNLNIAYQSLESLSPAVRKQAIIDIATAFGEGDPNAIMGRIMSDFPDFLQMEGSQQAFILEQYGQAFARTALAAKKLQEVQEKIVETESKISEEQSKVSGADAKERVSQNYKEDLGLLRETEVSLKKTTQGQLEFNAARAASIASGAGSTVPSELMGALGISYDSDQFKQDADKIATAWTIMQELPAEIDLNFVARFMVFGAGDEVLDADGVAKQGKKLRKAFEDLQSEDPQKRKEAQATIAFAYAIQVSQGVVDENGNQVSPEEISNRAFEELRAQFPDFDTLDIQTQGAMIRSRIDYIVEGAELAAQNAELEKNMATALAMGDGESARRIATKIEENNKKMGEISAKAAAVSETQYRTPSSAGGSSGGGQKSLGQQLAEQLKETQKMFNSLRNVTNNDAFKAFIAGPFAPEFLEYLRNQGEEGLKILQSGIKRIKQEYEKFKKIRMLEIGAQAIVAPFMRQEEIRSMQQQSNVAGILRSGRGFGMRGRGIDEEQLQYVMNAIPPDELATLAYLESKSKLNKQERQLLNSIRKNIREAISQAPEALAIQDAEAFAAGINQAEQSVQHFNNLVSRGIDPEMAQSMIEMGVTASMVSKSSAADIQKMAEDVKRVQIAENVQAITLSFAQMGQDIKGTMNIMSAIPNATQDTIDRLKSLGDMSLLTAEEIKHLNSQLMMMEAATDKARPALDRMSDQIETFVGSIEADIERINRLEIRPLELDISRIQKEMYPFQDEIKRLEKLIKPLNKEVDEFNEQIDRQQRLIRPLNKDIEKLREEEDELNKHYEERSKALDQVARANEKVIAQQRGQLDIASALSRGDIAGAARATRELQATMAQQRMDDAKAALEKEREDKRLEITKQIEAKEKEIKAINEGIEAIQEKIEQRQDAINEYSKLIAIENDKIADKQEEIEGIQRRIEQSKEKQLDLEEKIYKAQLLQSMVSTKRQIAEDARLGRTEAVQFGMSQLQAQMAVAGSTPEERAKFFEGIQGGSEIIGAAQQMATKTPQQIIAELKMNTEDLVTDVLNNLRTHLVDKLQMDLSVFTEQMPKPLFDLVNSLDEETGKFVGPDGVPYSFDQILEIFKQSDLKLEDFLGKDEKPGVFGKSLESITDSTRKATNSFLALPGLAIAARQSFEAIVRALDGKIKAANAAASRAETAAAAAQPQAKMYGGFIKRAFGGMISYRGSTEPAPGMAMGGKMKKYASGSFVPGIGITDSVPALLTPGEFVVRKSVAQAYGPMLQMLNSQIYPEMQRFAMGGFASGMGSMTRNASSSMFPSLTNVTRMRAFPTMAGRTQQIRVGASRGTASAGMSNIEYNYNVNVNAQTDASADDIANAVIYKVRRMEARQVKGTRIG